MWRLFYKDEQYIKISLGPWLTLFCKDYIFKKYYWIDEVDNKDN